MILSFPSLLKDKGRLLFLVILIMTSLSLHAQESLEQEDAGITIDAEDVIIQSSGRTSVRSVRIVTAEEIQRSPAANVGELFADIPGVTLTDTGIAGMKRIRLRAEAASRSLIIVDGIRMSEQKSLDGSPLLIDVASIERIEVIYGSASVLYGTDALGGVVKITTKKGGDKPVEAQTGVAFDSSSRLITTNGSLFGSVAGFNYRMGGSFTDSGERITANNEQIPYTDFNNYGLNNYLGYEWNSGLVGVSQQTFRSQSNVTDSMRVEHWDRDLVNVGFEQLNLGFLSKLEANLAYQRTFKDWRTSANVTLNTQQEAHSLIRGEFDLFETYHLTTGIDYRFIHLDSQTNTISNGATKAYKAQENDLGLFIHNKWQFHPDVSLTGGVRYFYRDIALTESNDVNSPVSSSQNQGVAGSLGLLYEIGAVGNFAIQL